MSLSVAQMKSPLYYDGSADHHQEGQSYLVVNRAIYTPAGVLNFNGSVLTFQVPALDFFSQMALVFDGFSATAANQSFSDGFGFNAIDQVKLQIGNSDVLTISGAQLFHNAMSDCETQDKKVHVLRNAGKENDLTQAAVVPITCLWSRLVALNPKRPFPSYLCGAGMNLQVQLKNCCEGSAASSYNTAFGSCRLLIRHVIDKSSSLQLKANQAYHYPCSIGAFIKNNFTGSTTVGAPVNIQLNSFYSGRLRNIKLLCIDTTDATTNKYTKSVRLTNIKLLQSGSTIYDFPEISSDIFESSVLLDNNTYVVGGTTRYIYNLNIAALDNVNVNMSHQGINLSNQFLQLSFNTPTTNNHDLYVMYEYSGSIIISDKSAMISYVQ